MPHLFSASGEHALATVMRARPLLAFDFDGTLAPIVSRPETARVPHPISRRLASLTPLLPVAVVTGRSVEDVRPRLDFEPHFIVGNHGAEDGHVEPDTLRLELDAVRRRLAACSAELAAAGITVEDKGLSIALHYRLSRDPALAREWIASVAPGPGSGLRTFPGKMVENIVHAKAPDKAHALHRLVAKCGVACAVFVGDDVNDEPVFASAPADWLTVRIGRDNPCSKAAYFLDSTPEAALLLEQVIRLVQEQR
jgi:trehalose 6-phosphate phosphatase